MESLWQVADFVRDVRRKLRFGEISRAPLRLVRIEVRHDFAECDWLARPADTWDESIELSARLRNESSQALADALAVRELIFRTLPSVSLATVRVFRESPEAGPELIIQGSVAREQVAPRFVQSLAMRAMLCGLRFVLEDGVLVSSDTDVRAVNY